MSSVYLFGIGSMDHERYMRGTLVLLTRSVHVSDTILLYLVDPL